MGAEPVRDSGDETSGDSNGLEAEGTEQASVEQTASTERDSRDATEASESAEAETSEERGAETETGVGSALAYSDAQFGSFDDDGDDASTVQSTADESGAEGSDGQGAEVVASHADGEMVEAATEDSSAEATEVAEEPMEEADASADDEANRLAEIQAGLGHAPVPSAQRPVNDAPLPLTTLRPAQQQNRAPRTESTVFAKLVLKGDEDAAVTVRVHDISASGVRLTVPRSEPVRLDHLLEPELIVRVERDGERRLLQLPCELVRVAGFDPTFVDVAFRFKDIELDDATMFHSMRHLLFL